MVLKYKSDFTMYVQIHSTHIRASCVGSDTLVHSIVIGNHIIDDQVTIRCDGQPWGVSNNNLLRVEAPGDSRVRETRCGTSQYKRLTLYPNHLRIWNYNNWNY